MLGRAWSNLLDARGLAYDAPLRGEMDLSHADTIARAFDTKYDLVINCAAWTDVDGAEDHEADANRINGDAVESLAYHAARQDAMLVHYSTDYVFSGVAPRAAKGGPALPWRVDDQPDPVNAYGRSKLLGEEAIARRDGLHLVIRTSWVYAAWGKNFVRTIAKLARERDTLQVVNDQHGRPTSARASRDDVAGAASRGGRAARIT